MTACGLVCIPCILLYVFFYLISFRVVKLSHLDLVFDLKMREGMYLSMSESIVG